MRRRGARPAPRPAFMRTSRCVGRCSAADRSDAVGRVEPRRSREWLGPVAYWRDGGAAPVWFLADPARTDLALIDPQSRRDVTRYPMERRGPSRAERHAAARRRLVSDTAPGWFVGEGWALTPETGGIAQSTADRRRQAADRGAGCGAGPARCICWSADAISAPPATRRWCSTAAIDGTPIETWTVDPGPGGASFLRFIDLPGGLPSGPADYAHLTSSLHAPSRRRGPRRRSPSASSTSSPSGTLIYGFGEGWHEAEYDNATGLSWRWTSGRSVLRVSPPQAVVLRLRGESPLKYFDDAPTVRIRAGDRIVGELRPRRDFEWTVKVPADAVRSGDGAIAIETDRDLPAGRGRGHVGCAPTRTAALRDRRQSRHTLIDSGSIGR